MIDPLWGEGHEIRLTDSFKNIVAKVGLAVQVCFDWKQGDFLCWVDSHHVDILSNLLPFLWRTRCDTFLSVKVNTDLEGPEIVRGPIVCQKLLRPGVVIMNIPANLVPVEDEAFSKLFLNCFRSPHGLYKATLLFPRTDIDL